MTDSPATTSRDAPAPAVARSGSQRRIAVRAGRFDAALRQHAPALAAIALVAVAVFGQVVWIRPFDSDNLLALAIGDRDLGDIVGASYVSYVPGYRPFTYLTVWAQYQVHGLEAWPYYAVQVALWAGAAAALYSLIWTLAGSRAAAALGAIAFLVDERGRGALYWIGERQSSLALICGTIALVLTLRLADREGRQRVAWIAIGALLLLAALSKEYGLAYAAAVPLAALAVRRAALRPALTVSVLAVVVYAVMRIALAGGADAAYCEGMAYFGTAREEVCYADLSTGDRIRQHAYNSGATLVSTFEPALFDDSGVLQVTAPDQLGAVVPKEAFLFGAGLTLLAFVGFLLLGRRSWPLLGLIVANALLNFMIYRTRNQVIGYEAVYAAAAVGGAWLVRRAAAWLPGRVVAYGAVAAAVVWVGWHGVISADRQVQYRSESNARDPCVAALGYPNDVSLDLVAALKRHYGMSDAECAAARQQLAAQAPDG